jgi:HPt (histidine-containing phosphotransfer) domain-containing protein
MNMNQPTVESLEVVFDLDALKSRCLGNLALVERVLASFATQLDADLGRLEMALAASDAAAFASVAHRIKGMSANVSARRLWEDASLAEERAVAQGVTDLPRHLEQMRVDRDDLAAAFAGVRLNGN